MTLTTSRPPNKRVDEVPGSRATDYGRYTVDDHELPNWHSTFSANADVATSTAHARGELDLLTVDLLRGTIGVLLRAGHYHVTLDLAELSGIDAAGVKLLVALQHSLATHAGELTIINGPSTSLGRPNTRPGGGSPPCWPNKVAEAHQWDSLDRLL